MAQHDSIELVGIESPAVQDGKVRIADDVATGEAWSESRLAVVGRPRILGHLVLLFAAFSPLLQHAWFCFWFFWFSVLRF